MVSGYLATGLSVLQIIGINAVLSGDNAVLVAMAIRRLPQSQRRPALVLGIGGAIGLQILATLVVARWTGELDMAQLHSHLDHPSATEADEPEAILDARTEKMPS